VDSIVKASLHANGWAYDQGWLRLIELDYTEEEWEAAVNTGANGLELNTPKPQPLREMKWPTTAAGVARITTDDMQHRRFILDDGNHRAYSMQGMILDGHKLAIEVCQRGMVLLDCNPETDRDAMVFSSMTANNKQQEVDTDFLADKLRQIKLVRVFPFSLRYIISTSHLHHIPLALQSLLTHSNALLDSRNVREGSGRSVSV